MFAQVTQSTLISLCKLPTDQLHDLAIDRIAQIAACSRQSVKTSLKTLEEARLIMRIRNKHGRGHKFSFVVSREAHRMVDKWRYQVDAE